MCMFVTIHQSKHEGGSKPFSNNVYLPAKLRVVDYFHAFA